MLRLLGAAEEMKSKTMELFEDEESSRRSSVTDAESTDEEEEGETKEEREERERKDAEAELARIEQDKMSKRITVRTMSAANGLTIA